jgi:hypothetical protein
MLFFLGRECDRRQERQLVAVLRGPDTLSLFRLGSWTARRHHGTTMGG